MTTEYSAFSARRRGSSRTGRRPNRREMNGSSVIKASQGFGGNLAYLIRRHIAPALGPIISTTFATMAGIVIIVESSLAFLGLGDPTAVSWGAMLNRALAKQGVFFSNVWTWVILPPGLGTTAVVFGFTFLAIGFDPHFNPRVKRPN